MRAFDSGEWHRIESIQAELAGLAPCEVAARLESLRTQGEDQDLLAHVRDSMRLAPTGVFSAAKVLVNEVVERSRQSLVGKLVLGRYEAKRLLGEGGMGRVYLARQLDLGRDVVVKVMHDHIATDAKFCDRFQRETLLMARFHHPGAVALYDASLTDPDGPCIVMEYVRGVTLESLLARNGRMNAPRVGRILGELCEVLQAAHDEGIIHRDLKPANLMIVEPDTPRERIKVLDFGLAKLVDPGLGRKVTDTNVEFAVGTPGYICPEQVRGEEMDHRGDLYSVGVTLFELLTGRLPFTGTSSMDVLLAHATEIPPTFAELGLKGWVPREIEELVMRCLAKDPKDRPQTGRELAERFEAALVEADSRPAPEYQTWGPSQAFPVPAPGPTDPPPLAVPAPSPDPNTLQFHLEAWLPEQIAVMKLRGYVHDAGGEVIELVPGCLRVRLPKETGSGTVPTWLRPRTQRPTPLDVEVRLRQADSSRLYLLTIHVVFRPWHQALLADAAWRKRCNQVFTDLRSYMMGRSLE